VGGVLGELRPVPAPATDTRERAERDALQPERNHGQMHLVQVLVEQDGDLEQRACGEPRHPHAPVSLQPEERAEPLLAATRRAERDQEMRSRVTDVPQAVRRSRRHDDDVAAADRQRAQSDPKAERARDTLEALPLARVDVRRHEASGPDEELGGHMRVGSVAEDDPLARDGILDRVYAVVDRSI
jgi:hypothetical protein